MEELLQANSTKKASRELHRFTGVEMVKRYLKDH